jgi:hypothetical protein
MSDTATTTVRPVSARSRSASECPEVCATRPEEDVRKLLTIARQNGYGSNWSDILNTCARAVLTPIYAGKRILNLQDKLGVKNFCPDEVGEHLPSGG